MASAMVNPLRLVVMGAPGAGKGTMCKWLVADFKEIISVSTGELLRANMRNETDLGKRAADLVARGYLVDDETVNGMIQCELMSRPDNHLLLDGYPRTTNQALALNRMTRLSAVINIEVPSNVIMERLLNRWVHPGSGRTYHITYAPPRQPGRDDMTGEPLIQRADDTETSVRKRLEEYKSSTHPLLNFYRDSGIMHTFRGSTSNEMYPAFKELVMKLSNGALSDR